MEVWNCVTLTMKLTISERLAIYPTYILLQASSCTAVCLRSDLGSYIILLFHFCLDRIRDELMHIIFFLKRNLSDLIK
jgi:hypothetical protein